MTPDSHPVQSIRSFVRNAWLLLAFQLLAAAGAVAVTAWAALQVRPMLAERERLAIEIAESRTRIASLAVQEQQARQLIDELERRAENLQRDLQGARMATPILTEAINAFHRREYGRAIVEYDEALRLNPGDPYIHNLKSYSQFKAGDFTGAAQTLARALELDPTYDWGYFDLARYQCAAGASREALHTISGALEARGEPIRRSIDFFLTKDGEFRRLCADILADLRELAAAPER